MSKETMKMYIEPMYPITKRERFDEDNMKPLLNDTNFNKKDRDRLSQYNKHRLSGSVINVSYKLGTGYDEYQLGRLYSEDGIGLQSFRFDIRNPLAQKYYWDIDVDNCHYRIAEKQCFDYGLKSIYISKYINEREYYLKLVSDNRKKAKTEFLKILYGGDIKLFRDDYQEVEGEVSYQGIAFLKDLQIEVNNLMKNIWNEHKHLHNLKCGKEKKPLSKKSNPQASLMSIIFQTEERKILMCMDYVLKQYNRNLSVFIHDGGYVDKIEGETCFPIDLMNEISKNVSEITQYTVVLTQKPIVYDWKPSDTYLTPYQIMKDEFEKNHFFVGNNFIKIYKDNYIEDCIKYTDMKIRLKKMNYIEYENEKAVKKFFFEEWIQDKERRDYDRIVFNPDLKNTPPEHYNLFKGFNAEKFKPNKPLSKLEITLLVKPILFHMGLLVGDENFEWSKSVLFFTRWLAKKIQDPKTKINVSILLRAVDELFVAGGGEGKNFFTEWFGNEIIGEKYFYVCGNNKELYGDFNAQFEGKLLILIEEANGKANRENADMLKSNQSCKKRNVNKKYQNVYTVEDHADLMFGTNNRCPLYTPIGNRRLTAYDCSKTFRFNRNYFSFLNNYLNKPDVKWAFYQYLLNFKTYELSTDFEINIPKTAALIEMQKMCAPVLLKWIVSELTLGIIRNGYAKDLYTKYEKWVKKNREAKDESIGSFTNFSQLLNTDVIKYIYGNDKLNPKHKRNGLMFVTWNIPFMVKKLKELNFLEDEFVYIENPLSQTDTDEEEVEEDD